MTECHRFREELILIADGQSDTVADGVRPLVEAHVRTCVECRRAIARINALNEIFASPPAPSIDTDRWEEMWDTLEVHVRRRAAEMSKKTWPTHMKSKAPAVSKLRSRTTRRFLSDCLNRILRPFVSDQMMRSVRDPR